MHEQPTERRGGGLLRGIEAHNLTIHISEEATRIGTNTECYLLIDLTLSRGNSN